LRGRGVQVTQATDAMGDLAFVLLVVNGRPSPPLVIIVPALGGVRPFSIVGNRFLRLGKKDRVTIERIIIERGLRTLRPSLSFEIMGRP
jgi:hypothetical protein